MLGLYLLQAILAQTEFFPIRYRVNRAKENFRDYQIDLALSDYEFWNDCEKTQGTRKLSSKVSSQEIIFFNFRRDFKVEVWQKNQSC